jgi:hypothetical protein
MLSHALNYFDRLTEGETGDTVAVNICQVPSATVILFVYLLNRQWSEACWETISACLWVHKLHNELMVTRTQSRNM